MQTVTTTAGGAKLTMLRTLVRVARNEGMCRVFTRRCVNEADNIATGFLALYSGVSFLEGNSTAHSTKHSSVALSKPLPTSNLLHHPLRRLRNTQVSLPTLQPNSPSSLRHISPHSLCLWHGWRPRREPSRHHQRSHAKRPLSATPPTSQLQTCS